MRKLETAGPRTLSGHSPGPTPGRIPTAWLEPSGPAAAPVESGWSDDPGQVYPFAWLARALATARPKRHVDISSSASFAAIASAFVPVDFYEFEPLRLNLSNLRTGILDFERLPFRDGSVPSLSSAGIIERLGAAGGSRDDRDAMSELARVMAPDGSLLLVLPVGRPRPVAGSHRVYSFGEVLDQFEGFELEEFSLVPDSVGAAGMLRNPDTSLADRQDQGTGCFWLRKPAA